MVISLLADIVQGFIPGGYDQAGVAVGRVGLGAEGDDAARAARAGGRPGIRRCKA